MEPPLVSVILVSYGTRSLTLDALESVREEGRTVPLEAIVVDNASTDGSADAVAAAHPWSTLVRESENRGFAAGANRGASRARGEWLLFLNPDARLTGGALATLLRVAKGLAEAGAIGPRIVDGSGRVERSGGRFIGFGADLVHALRLDRLSRWIPIFKGTYFTRLPESPAPIDWVTGACLLVRRDRFEAVHGFDESFFLYVEDMDLCYRLTQAGWKSWIVPNAEIRHDRGRSPRGDRVLIDGGDGPERFVKKNGIRYPWVVQRILRILALARWSVSLTVRHAVDRLTGRPDPERVATLGLCRRSLAALLGLRKEPAR